MFIHPNVFTVAKKTNTGFLSSLYLQLVVVLLLLRSALSANVTLYYTPECAPCRAVQILLHVIRLEGVHYKLLNLTLGEHLDPKFLKINPQHSVPTFVDGDLVLTESDAILIYLHNKYAPYDQDFLYPRHDLKRRTLINQRLFFNAGTLYPRFIDAYWPILFEGKPFDDEKIRKLEEAIVLMNDVFINDSLYIVGESPSIADVSLVATVSTIEAVEFDIDNRYIWVRGWSKRCKTILRDYWELSDPIVEQYKKLYKNAHRRLFTVPL